jgi:hypothetical protein
MRGQFERTGSEKIERAFRLHIKTRWRRMCEEREENITEMTMGEEKKQSVM